MIGHNINIHQTEDRHITSEGCCKIELMVWSDKLDLLALSNSKGEISLHRLNSQRVWLLPPPPQYVVRHIAWRPDGRVIAVAYAPKVINSGKEIEGKVYLVDAENKNILYMTSVTDDVSCLAWLQEKEYEDLDIPSRNQFGTSDSFLPKLPSLTQPFSSLPDNLEDKFEDSKIIKGQNYLNFLLIGTCDGNLYLSVFGLLSCGLINISKFMSTEEGKNRCILQAKMSLDMTSLYLLIGVDYEQCHTEAINIKNGDVEKEILHSIKEEESTLKQTSRLETNGNSRNLDSAINEPQEDIRIDPNTDDRIEISKRALQVLILDTTILSSKSQELYTLSLKYGQVSSLLDYLAQTMSSVIESWENIYLSEVEDKLSKYAASHPDGSLSADFLELLLFGVPTKELENLLLRDLNDKRIIELGESIDLNHSNIKKLILKNILSVGQHLAYHLAEIKGMAKLPDCFKMLGLEENTVSIAYSLTVSFLIKATQIQFIIDESLKKYKAFFKLLYEIIQSISEDHISNINMSQLNQQDIEFIADYLSKIGTTVDYEGTKIRASHLECVSKYLVNQHITSPNNFDLNQWQQLLEKNNCLSQYPNLISKSNIKSLEEQYKQLKEAIGNVFKSPEFAISNMFHEKNCLNIGYVPYKKLSMCLAYDETILLSLIEINSPCSFKLLQIPRNGVITDVVFKSVSFKSDNKVLMKCLDIQFYLPEILAVLFEEQDEDSTPVIMQVMTKPIREHRLDVINGDTLLDSITCRIPDFVASSFAVSGSRKIAAILSENMRGIRIINLKKGEEEDDEEEILFK